MFICSVGFRLDALQFSVKALVYNMLVGQDAHGHLAHMGILPHQLYVYCSMLPLVKQYYIGIKL